MAESGAQDAFGSRRKLGCGEKDPGARARSTQPSASSTSKAGQARAFLSITVQFGRRTSGVSGVEKFADLQLHGGVECRVCVLCKAVAVCKADCHNFNVVSTMQAASVQPDVFLVTSDKGDKCKMIPTVKYHQPCTKVPWPSGRRASFKRRPPPPPDRALKLVDSILIR